MRVAVLASGSGGNACVVESGRTRVLVDAGLSAKEIEKRLAERGIAASTIRGIFVTHEHGDHSIGALTFAARFGCSLYATAGTADALGLEGNLFSPLPSKPTTRGSSSPPISDTFSESSSSSSEGRRRSSSSSTTTKTCCETAHIPGR